MQIIDWFGTHFWTISYPILLLVIGIVTAIVARDIDVWSRWFTGLWLLSVLGVMTWAIWSGFAPAKPKPPVGPKLMVSCYLQAADGFELTIDTKGAIYDIIFTGPKKQHYNVTCHDTFAIPYIGEESWL